MKSLLRSFYHNLSGLKTPKDWPPYSHLLIRSSNSDWVLDTIGKEMLDVCSDINIPTIKNRYAYKLQRQSIFYTSKYEALLDFKKTTNRIAFPYYHGDPRTHKEFKKHIDTINLHHKDIHKIQVSHSYTEDLILNTGIDAQKVNRIPISIDINKFDFTNDKKKSSIRK